MSYNETEVLAAVRRIEKYRAGQDGEIGAALAVVGLSSERVDKESAIRDDMIRVAHRVGASLRQIAEVSGLNRKTVSNIVGADKQGYWAATFLRYFQHRQFGRFWGGRCVGWQDVLQQR